MHEHGIRLWGKRYDINGKLTREFQLKETDPDYETLLIYREAYGRNQPSD
jgi:hypothetical protein